jgi:hypothetical protein
MGDQNQPTKQNPGKKRILMVKEKMINQKRSSVHSHTTLNAPDLIWSHEPKQGQAWSVLKWEKDLQGRLLRNKQFGNKGGMSS